MIYKDKEVQDFTDDELKETDFFLTAMYNNYNIAQTDPRYIKKFQNQPVPTINPVFIQLKQAIEDEIAKRGI
jgi:hypothetical protein